MLGLDRGLGNIVFPSCPNSIIFNNHYKDVKGSRAKGAGGNGETLEGHIHQAYKVCSMFSKYCSRDEEKWKTLGMSGF